MHIGLSTVSSFGFSAKPVNKGEKKDALRENRLKIRRRRLDALSRYIGPFPANTPDSISLAKRNRQKLIQQGREVIGPVTDYVSKLAMSGFLRLNGRWDERQVTQGSDQKIFHANDKRPIALGAVSTFLWDADNQDIVKRARSAYMRSKGNIFTLPDNDPERLAAEHLAAVQLDPPLDLG